MYDEAELYRIQAELAQENSALVAEMNKADRVANSITDQMYAECQELLQLFGIPWIVSPTGNFLSIYASIYLSTIQPNI